MAKLVLTRKLGEKINIGNGAERVSVTVHEIHRGKVRLLVEAPANIPVNRDEITRLIDRGLNAGNAAGSNNAKESGHDEAQPASPL